MTTYTTTPAAIVGAGLAGLIAAHAWPNVPLYELGPEPLDGTGAHKALLRFRSDAVARLTGIEFRRVLVRKGLWCGGAFREPDIQLANMYERKVTGAALDGGRSVWNLAPVERWIAPEDFYAQLLANCAGRIRWSAPYDFSSRYAAHINNGTAVISTMPLPELLGTTGIAPQADTDQQFRRSGIYVARYALEDVNLSQTIYFPDPDTPLYRASIVGGLLICELTHAADEDDWFQDMTNAFGLWRCGGLQPIRPLGAVQQRYGKIVPVSDDAARKRLLFTLTHDLGIYSLGRFATWRNILLDDVVDDIAVIKRMLRAGAHAGGGYELRKAL